MTDSVLFDQLSGTHGDIGLITLNRNAALNALDLEMMHALTQQLLTWQIDTDIQAVVVRSNNEKAFCAGGDIRKVYSAGKAGDLTVNQFFWNEYRLNHLIACYPKPYIPLLDGITMGGGVGISLHSPYAIATENLSFAMPETGIGFFPDVGSTYLLNHCPDHLGMYLGLTGARLNVTDAHYAGLINHYIPQAQLDDFVNTLRHEAINHDTITATIQAHATLPAKPNLAQYQPLINACFAPKTVEAIIDKLNQNSHPWCQPIVQQLASKSPTSLKITLQQLQLGKHLSLAECLQMEYRLVNHFLQGHDFYEGVRALLVDKDRNPQWQPADLAHVSTADVDRYFQPSNKLTFITP